MRTLRRNKRKLYYATFVEKEQILDSSGRRTGEYRSVYSDPVELMANYSQASGLAAEEVFGVGSNYSCTMTVEDKNCPIDENSIVWIDKSPNEKYNFVVVRKAVSVNSIMYALQEVQ